MKANTTNKIEEVRSLSDNKKCFDCHEKGTTYVVMDFGIFVCSGCSGIHREMTHKAKGISMCNFSDKEIEFLILNGNANVQKTLMGEYSAKLYPEPDKKDIVKMKEFFKQKYTQKRFQKKAADSDDSDNASDSDNEKKKKKKKEQEEKKRRHTKKAAKKKDSSSEEEEEEDPKHAKVPKLLQESKPQPAKGLKFPMGGAAQKLAANNQTNGQSSASENVKKSPPKGRNSESGNNITDLLEIGFDPVPIKAITTPQNNGGGGGWGEPSNEWSAWGTFQESPSTNPQVKTTQNVQSQQPAPQQQNRQSQDLINSLSGLYNQPPVGSNPNGQGKANFMPGTQQKAFSMDDPFQELIQEQTHQNWIHQQTNQPRQPAGHPQPGIVNQPHQQPGFGGVPVQSHPMYPGGQPVQQPAPVQNAGNIQQQQQIMQMQQQMLQLMQQQQANPNQQQMVMMQQMQQMIMMMQSMMTNTASTPVQAQHQPPAQATQQQQQQQKYNPQDNMFSDLFKSAATHQQPAKQLHESPYNPFGGPQMQPASSPGGQQQFNPWGGSAPAQSQQQTQNNSNNPFDMFND